MGITALHRGQRIFRPAYSGLTVSRALQPVQGTVEGVSARTSGGSSFSSSRSSSSSLLLVACRNTLRCFGKRPLFRPDGSSDIRGSVRRASNAEPNGVDDGGTPKDNDQFDRNQCAVQRLRVAPLHQRWKLQG